MLASSCIGSTPRYECGEVIALSDVPKVTWAERLKKLDDIAEEMAGNIQKELFSRLNATLERAGQTMDQQGKPFDAETILEALDSIDVNFDANGQPLLPTIVIHPNMTETVQQAAKRMENDPALKARYDAIIQRKRVAYYDREAARKLVG